MSGALRELEEVAYARLLSLVGELQGPGLGGGEQRLAPPCSYSPFPMRLYTKWDISSEALELQRKGVGMGGGSEGDCNLTRSGLGWREYERQAAVKGGIEGWEGSCSGWAGTLGRDNQLHPFSGIADRLARMWAFRFGLKMSTLC